MRNKPRIRFKGFTEDWEQRKLSDITDVIMGQSPSSKNYTDNPNDNILVQGNADLKDGKVIPRLWTKEITKTIDKDGIILTVRAPVGDVAKTDYKVVLGRGVAGIKGNDFIYQFLQKLQYNRHWVSLSSGSTFESINSNDIKDLIIDIPSIEEQNKISMLLNNVNSIITLHQRKLEKLKLAKKALLQKLFPKNGSKFPELRFKGFADAWEQRKLSEFVDKAVDNRGKTPPLDENGAHPLIEVAALGGVYPDYSKVEKYLSDDVFNTNLRAYIKKDDILFTTVGSIGLVSLMDSREEAAIAQNIVAFRAKENFLPEYLYALFSNEDNQYKAKRIAMVAVQPSIKVSQLVNVEYMISTNIEEQERIGVFFSSLQSLITLHQRKLDKLQDVKKGLLQKMFV